MSLSYDYMLVRKEANAQSLYCLFLSILFSISFKANNPDMSEVWVFYQRHF